MTAPTSTTGTPRTTGAEGVPRAPVPVPVPVPHRESSLSRALSILAVFGEERAELTLADIVAATGLPPGSAHRYLAELVRWGGVERTGRGRYAVGLRLWQLGSLAPRERRLRDVALPVLEELFETTHEVVHLVVLDDDRALYIEKLMPRDRRTVSSRVGHRLPLHATGPGKVLLAYGPPELLERVVAQGLRRCASQTIVDPIVLRRTLATVAAQGFSVSRNEMTEGNASAAAPVFGADGSVIAAISVVVRDGQPNLSGLVDAVRMAAAVISRAMGGRRRR